MDQSESAIVNPVVLDIRVIADYHPDGTPAYELLTVRDTPKGLLLLYSPGFVLGVAAGDTLAVDESGHAQVLEHGGNICIQVFSESPSAEFSARASEVLLELGAIQNGFNPDVMVFTLPYGKHSFATIESKLRALTARPNHSWMYGNIFDKNDQPLNWWVDD